VVGRFEAGVGTFECDDTLRGMPIAFRYIWSEIEATLSGAAGFFTRRRQVVGGELGHALHPPPPDAAKKKPASVRGARLENFVRQPGSSFSDGFGAPVAVAGAVHVVVVVFAGGSSSTGRRP